MLRYSYSSLASKNCNQVASLKKVHNKEQLNGKTSTVGPNI